MGRPKNKQPSYLEHKPSGQARVRINGIDHYLGPFNSPESLQKYHQLLLDHAHGRQITAKAVTQPVSDRLTVMEFIEKYIDHAKSYYGPQSGEKYRIQSAVRPLVALYASCPVDEFSPLKLKRVVEKLIADGDTRKEIQKRDKYRTLSRTSINDYLHLLKRIFKWGVSEEYVPPTVFEGLKSVEGIKKGRGKLAGSVHEPRKVTPVPLTDIEATKKKCIPEIAAMIDLQLLTGMRPDEVTIMRPCDIQTSSGKCWTYRPQQHKNSWRDGMEDKEVLLGPRARKILRPFLKECPEPTDYLFSPRKVAERWNREQIEETGKEPAFVKLNAMHPPRECYDDKSYAQAVRRAAKRAKVTEWTPGRLRHNAATTIRAEFGAESAKLVLGHRHLSTTEIYAEKDRKRYVEIMSRLG